MIKHEIGDIVRHKTTRITGNAITAFSIFKEVNLDLKSLELRATNSNPL